MIMNANVIDCTGGEDSAMRGSEDDATRGGVVITGDEGRTGVGDQVSGSSWGDADTGGVGLEKHGRERLTGGGRAGTR